MSRSIYGLTDLRTEDSGKLGCKLSAEGKEFKLLKDFAVTGKCTFVLAIFDIFQPVKIVVSDHFTTKFSRLEEMWVQIMNLTFVLQLFNGYCYGNQIWGRIGKIGLLHLHSS